MTKRENDAIWAAAEEANRKFGQWMPQLWIEIFIKELASTPPATPAGFGADEIARVRHGDADLRTVLMCWFEPEYPSPEETNFAFDQADKTIRAILALLSRAGDQSNSTQKDGSR